MIRGFTAKQAGRPGRSPREPNWVDVERVMAVSVPGEEAEAEPEDDGDEWRQARIGGALIVSDFRNKIRELQVQKGSVYGAAVAMPQVARSAGWPHLLAVLTFRAYIFLCVNYMTQLLILFMIAKEELIWDLFAGQMYLCDTGAQMDECPDGPNCVGPGGTIMTPPRMYSWDMYSVRTFVRDSMLALHPDKADAIHSTVDPGEYGVESYWCRWLCILLFMTSVMSDLKSCSDLAKLLFFVPTQNEDWISYSVPEWADKNVVKQIHSYIELDLVKIQVAGMSFFWKAVNFTFILLPKLLVWKITCEAGVTFLMETSGIEDLIVNSVALAFILNIDEMICEQLMSQDARMILEKLQGFMEDDNDPADNEDHEELLKHYAEREFRWLPFGWLEAVPPKMFSVFGFAMIFGFGYYSRNCVLNDRGGWVSKPMHLPVGTKLGFLQAFFPNLFHVESEPEPFWTYTPAS